MYVSTELLSGVSPSAAQPFPFTPFLHSGGVKQYRDAKFIASVLFVVSLQCLQFGLFLQPFKLRETQSPGYCFRFSFL